MPVKAVFNLQPVSAPRQVRSDAWKPRPQVLRYRAFRDHLRLLANQQKFELTAGELTVMFILEMPESWSEKKKSKMDSMPHTQKPDGDNLLKAFQDTFLKDDCGLWKVNFEKRWGRKGKIVVFESNPLERYQYNDREVITNQL